MLFNMAVSHLPPTTVLGFTDDSVITGKDKLHATHLLHLAESMFQQIGLKISAHKSSAIIVEDECLRSENITTLSNSFLKSINADDKVMYLGVTFSDSLAFDQNSLVKDLLELLTPPMNNILKISR